MAQQCRGCGGSCYARTGKPDDALCGGCRRGMPWQSTGDQEKAVAFVAARKGKQPAAAAPRAPARPTALAVARPAPAPSPQPPRTALAVIPPDLPDPRALPDEYLIACFREARRRVDGARLLANGIDAIAAP